MDAQRAHFIRTMPWATLLRELVAQVRELDVSWAPAKRPLLLEEAERRADAIEIGPRRPHGCQFCNDEVLHPPGHWCSEVNVVRDRRHAAKPAGEEAATTCRCDYHDGEWGCAKGNREVIAKLRADVAELRTAFRDAMALVDDVADDAGYMPRRLMDEEGRLIAILERIG